MKTILNSLLVLVAAASCSLAQIITVTITPKTLTPTDPACSFTASEFTQGISNNFASGSGALHGALEPFTITETADKCLTQLVIGTFTALPTVTVTIKPPTSATATAQLKYTLTTVSVTRINQTVDQSEIELRYQAIKVEDLVRNFSYTCVALTGTCD
jgi:hypothetical protein